MRHVEPTEEQIRSYAAGSLGWAELRWQDISYADMLAGLGRFGLRPPVAPMEGPNVAARQRGMLMLREALAEPKP